MGSSSIPDELRSTVLRAAAAASHAGMMPANQGNVSARDPSSGLVVITPHDRPYDQMRPSDLVVVDLEGAVVDGDWQPSFDTTVHCTVYRERPNVGAVMHTEPPYVNAFGAVGLPLEPVTTTGLKSANGTVPIMPFRAIRDAEFARQMLQVMGDQHAVVWGNHGLLVIGERPSQVLDRSLGIEFNAQVLAVARSLGKPQSLAYLDAAMVVA